MINLQENEYEGEVNIFQNDLQEAQTEFKRKKGDMEDKINSIRKQH